MCSLIAELLSTKVYVYLSNLYFISRVYKSKRCKFLLDQQFNSSSITRLRVKRNGTPTFFIMLNNIFTSTRDARNQARMIIHDILKWMTRVQRNKKKNWPILQKEVKDTAFKKKNSEV